MTYSRTLIDDSTTGEIAGVGGYSEYTVADQRISFKVPSSTPKEDASTVPLAAAIAWLALFSKGCLNLDRPKATGASVLVWGGSCMQIMPVQLFPSFAPRKANDEKPVLVFIRSSLQLCVALMWLQTCSSRNGDLVRSCGAKHVFDYNDPKVIEKIKEVTPNVQHVFDTIGNANSSSLSSRAFGDHAGNLCAVRPGKTSTEHVTKCTRVTDVLVWTAFLKDHRYAHFHWPVRCSPYIKG